MTTLKPTNCICAAVVASVLAISPNAFSQTSLDSTTAPVTHADKKAEKEQAKADKKATVAQAKADKKKTDAQADADKERADARVKDAKDQ
ncbi:MULTISPECIES: hypothetical protein [unclassified Paraburkholderia]|uniref:hypothetical protein n=1 Tax=unclassified Paraburkholderia TaxID=2615204 RepID=UPI002AAFAE0F|nr:MULTISPECIES: hypothetical protein [unclassified Paraburkholderia]